MRQETHPTRHLTGQIGLVYLISEVLLTRRYVFPAVLFVKFGGLSTLLRQAFGGQAIC